MQLSKVKFDSKLINNEFSYFTDTCTILALVKRTVRWAYKWKIVMATTTLVEITMRRRLVNSSHQWRLRMATRTIHTIICKRRLILICMDITIQRMQPLPR